MSETNVPTKREIFLHYPTIEIAKRIVYYFNFGLGWNNDPAILHFTGCDHTPTEEGLYKENYDIVYYKKRFLCKKRYVFGRIQFFYEKADIGKRIVHQINIQAYGLPTEFQELKKEFESYYGPGRVNLTFIWNTPRDW